MLEEKIRALKLEKKRLSQGQIWRSKLVEMIPKKQISQRGQNPQKCLSQPTLAKS